MKLMLTLLAGFLLTAPLADMAVAQKRPQTGGILIEIARVGDENNASGEISFGGDFLVLEIKEVATQNTHLIACYKSDNDCGLYSPGGEITAHNTRYLMRHTKSDYPENKALTDNVASGTGVEMTGPVQVLDENQKWVKPTGEEGTTKLFFLKNKEMHLLFPPGHDSSRCTLEKIRLGITPAGYCRGTRTYTWVPMKMFPCAACTITDQEDYRSSQQDR